MKKFILTIIAALLFTACPTEDQTPELEPPTLIAPANGSTISQNPPTFIWSTVDEDQILYRLEVATNSSFTDSSILLSTAIVPPDTQFLPPYAFSPGTFYWHVCTQEDC